MSHLIELIRANISNLVYQAFPSLNAELILGLLIGAKDITELQTFNDMMRGIGLVHIVVVSGYNINLVFELVLKLVGSKFKFLNLFSAQILVTLYALITGFQIPTARALIMTSILYWTRFLGYKVSPFYLLIFSAFVIILYDREALTNLSFQLSFAATLGLITLGNVLSKPTSKLPLPVTLGKDLSTTFSAQIFVLPIIYKAFRSLNLVGFLSNPVILWLVPLMTITSIIFISASFVSPTLGLVAKFPLLLLTTIFIKSSNFMFRIFSA